MIRLFRPPPRQPMIYFAHIGKTAGTSFRHAAIRHFGRRRCVAIYTPTHSGGTKTPTKLFFDAYRKGRPVAENEPAARAVLDWCAARRVRFFATHQNGIFRNFIEPAQTVTFLREPIARLVSNYNFAVARGWQDPEEDFETFAMKPKNRNLQRRSIAFQRFDEIGLVGISERYDESLAAFAEVFGESLPSLRRNRTKPAAGAVRRDGLPDAVLRRVADYNQADMELYARALAAFERRLAA